MYTSVSKVAYDITAKKKKKKSSASFITNKRFVYVLLAQMQITNKNYEAILTWHFSSDKHPPNERKHQTHHMGRAKRNKTNKRILR